MPPADPEKRRLYDRLRYQTPARQAWYKKRHTERMKDPTYVARKRKRARQQCREFLDWMADIKLARGCDICDWRGTPSTLQWHHKDPKTKLRARNRTQWMAEMAKCQLLCANCHLVIEDVRRARRRQLT